MCREPKWESVRSSWRLTPEQGARLYVHPGKKMFYWYCTLEDNVQPYVGAPSAVSGISRTAANAKKACITAWHEIKKGMNELHRFTPSSIVTRVTRKKKRKRLEWEEACFHRDGNRNDRNMPQA